MDRIDRYFSRLTIIRDHDKFRKEIDGIHNIQITLNSKLIERSNEIEKLKEELAKKDLQSLKHVLEELDKGEPVFTDDERKYGIPTLVVQFIAKWHKSKKISQNYCLSCLTNLVLGDQGRKLQIHTKKAVASSMMGRGVGAASFWPVTCL